MEAALPAAVGLGVCRRQRQGADAAVLLQQLHRHPLRQCFLPLPALHHRDLPGAVLLAGLGREGADQQQKGHEYADKTDKEPPGPCMDVHSVPPMPYLHPYSLPIMANNAWRKLPAPEEPLLWLLRGWIYYLIFTARWVSPTARAVTLPLLTSKIRALKASKPSWGTSARMVTPAA